jgi:hypothetical protein
VIDGEVCVLGPDSVSDFNRFPSHVRQLGAAQDEAHVQLVRAIRIMALGRAFGPAVD